MEGLLDHGLRDILTRVGGVDRCVSEFIRITDQLLPSRSFVRVVPELKHGSRTPAGVPVRPQLLGSDPVCLAENAARLAELAPAGIDLNFGCPAKTVNRHRGGAVLLDEPELIHAIVAAVRRAVPAPIAVSAKMRLGNADDARLLDCAHAIASAGASELAVHARTKAHGYRPPAYWESIAAVREAVRLPVIANGEIWSADDAARCRQVTGCSTLMLGRGMVRRPPGAGHPRCRPARCGAARDDGVLQRRRRGGPTMAPRRAPAGRLLGRRVRPRRAPPPRRAPEAVAELPARGLPRGPAGLRRPARRERPGRHQRLGASNSGAAGAGQYSAAARKGLKNINNRST